MGVGTACLRAAWTAAGSWPESCARSAPLGAELVGPDAVVLGAAGVECRGPGGLGGVQAPGRELVLDLAPSGGEQFAELGWDADDLGGAFVDGSPVDAEAAGELVAEVGLVEVAGGAGLPQQRLAVERPPLPVLAVREIRDEHVGVQLRVAGAAGPMRERGGDEPVDRNDLVSVDATTGSAPLAFGASRGPRRLRRRARRGTSRAVSGSPSPHSTDTDLGAENVRSNPGTRSFRVWVSRIPVLGSRPSRIASRARPPTSPLNPKCATASPVQRPGASPSPE